jgi:hypothetical protein
MTGYTHELINKKLAFPQFAMLCARAMGACVMMRDEPFDAAIPDAFKPSNYNARRIVAATKELNRLVAMTPAKREKFGAKVKGEQFASLTDMKAKTLEANNRLMQSHADVGNWQPPTSHHEGLKEFMLQQITTSLSDTAYEDKSLAKCESTPPLGFWSEAVAQCAKDIAYHTKAQAEEDERTNQRNQWLADLRKSLSEPA